MLLCRLSLKDFFANFLPHMRFSYVPDASFRPSLYGWMHLLHILKPYVRSEHHRTAAADACNVSSQLNNPPVQTGTPLEVKCKKLT